MFAPLLVAAAFVTFGTADSVRGQTYPRGGHAYQTIWIIGTHGAECRFTRGGKVLAQVIAGTTRNIAEIDVTKSHRAIALRCGADGFKPLSKILSWRKEQPCAASPDSGGDGVQHCADNPGGAARMRYPAAVPVYLDPGR